MTNLGGISIQTQRPDIDSKYIKPANYLGKRFEKHFVQNTDNPTKPALVLAVLVWTFLKMDDKITALQKRVDELEAAQKNTKKLEK